MTRKLLFVSMAMIPLFAYSQGIQKPQLELHSFKESLSEGGERNLSASLIKDWPKDENGDNDCALIRVKFENLPNEDCANVKFKTAASAPIRKYDDRMLKELGELWVFVTPTESTTFEATLDKYGTSTRLYDLRLKPRGVYDVVLKNDKTISINIITQPKGTIASLSDTGQKADTNGTITNVSLGKHTLVISLEGREVKREVIEVTEGNVKFEYDLREKKSVTFTSDPSKADLYINNELKGKTPITIELAYDSYEVRAELSANEVDSRPITINQYTDSKIVMEPIQKKTFEVYALYGGHKTNADLYVDNKHEGSNQASYTLTKPLGKTYKMSMTHNGASKKRTIRVVKNMNFEQEFKIAARNKIVWPWQRKYDVTPMGFSVGYVTKQLVTTGEGAKLKENGVWDDGEGKSLHGMQFGLHFQPCFSYGLGLYTGLYYELYMSWNDDYEYNKFMEHCIYVPVHAYYRLPFAQKVALSIHGGLGLNYAVYGAYSDTDNNYEDYTDVYGEEPYPKRFNMAAEVGVSFRVKAIQVNAQFAKGITNHECYSSQGDYKTRMNKVSLSVSYVFGSGL